MAKSLKERILNKEFVEIKIRKAVATLTFPGNEVQLLPVNEFFALFDESTAVIVKKEKAAVKKNHDAAVKAEETANKKREAADKKKVADKEKKAKKDKK